MLKLGNTNINKAYIGGTEINKMYLGDTIVFDKTPMHLSYNPTTSLNLAIETVSGDDWEIDWGDGVWQRYVSSSSTYRDVTFGSSTSGVARVRSATGRGLSDLHRVQSNAGTWSFDVADLCATYHAYFNGDSMALTGDVGDIKATNAVYFIGNLMALTGDVADIKAANAVYFNGDSMALTGDVGDIKATNQAYFIGDSMALTGDVSDIKATNAARFDGNLMTLTGDVADIKADTTARFQGDSMTLTGDVADIKATDTANFRGDSMTLTGDVADIKATYSANFTGNSMALTYTTTTWTKIPTNIFYLSLATGHLTTAEVSQMLIDMDASGITGTATLDFRYNNGAPNALGITAADNLRGKGYTVLTN